MDSKLSDVLEFLADKRWHLADEICEAVGISGRHLRHVSEQTGQIISGDLGHKLTVAATEKEFTHAVRSMYRRSDRIFRHAERIQEIRGRS